MFYLPVNNFSVMSRQISWVEPVQRVRIKCLAQVHNTVPRKRLKSTTVRSGVEHSPIVFRLCCKQDLFRILFKINFSVFITFSHLQRYRVYIYVCICVLVKYCWVRVCVAKKLNLCSRSYVSFNLLFSELYIYMPLFCLT